MVAARVVAVTVDAGLVVDVTRVLDDCVVGAVVGAEVVGVVGGAVVGVVGGAVVGAEVVGVVGGAVVGVVGGAVVTCAVARNAAKRTPPTRTAPRRGAVPPSVLAIAMCPRANHADP